MLPFFSWWLIIEILGLVGLPIVLRLFRHLPDKGYAFAKPLGLLLTSYIFWLLVTFGFLFNTRPAIIFCMVLVALTSLYLLARDGTIALPRFWREQRRSILATEVLFAIAFALWSFYRAFNPEITATEKPMDFAFLNAILQSRTFPPHDPWLSGFAISYYYFGYFMMAVLTKLSGIASSITYNLAIALLFALTVTGSFSLVYNLVARANQGHPSVARTSFGPVGWGLLGSFFVAVMGNLEGSLEILHSHGFGSTDFWSWIGIKDLTTPYVSQSLLPTDNWWWWRASRVIPGTINEFPFFSFMLGDLHPHVMALPFTLLALGLALNVLYGYKSQGSANEGLEGHANDEASGARWPEFLLLPLCVGGLAFMNSWDFPTYSLILIAAFTLQRYLSYGGLRGAVVKEAVWFALRLIGLGLLLYVPFYVGFKSQASGILPVLLGHTRLHHYLIFWGPFIFMVVSFLAYGLWNRTRGDRLSVPLWLLAALVGIAFIVAFFALFKLWVSVLLTFLIASALVFFYQHLHFPDSSLLFALLLIAVGLLLTLGVEVAFIVDTFGTRMNTVFKLYYQAWVLLAIGSAYAVYHLSRGPLAGATSWNRVGRYAWLLLFLVLILASSIYPLGAVYTRTNGFAGPPTLDGTAYMRNFRPADYAAIAWLKANAPGEAVIVEVPGPQYSEYARVSSQTGLATLLGWGGHELQWRGNYDEPGRREPDIETIYNSQDIERVSSLLKKYEVSYVYVGSLERAKYDPLSLAKFAQFMDVVYEQGDVTIYKVRG
ncbi:MAG: DUF2298 domain-containing protein [Anaerolineae bacterium]